ncbi:MAG: hypothetical protein KDA24_05995 [Deltaproteobacteria bacterium]|nr:hypothetical protein [Deltaproteobacteria bacterium]
MRTQWWNLLLLSLGLALAGCPATGDDDDAANDDDTVGNDDDAACAGILSVSPEQDETDVFGDKVAVTWDAVPTGGALAVTDEAGAAVAGSTTDDDNGRTLIFTADSTFTASTTFSVTISWDCEADVAYDFTTGPYGDAVGTESDLIGRAFNLDLASADFVEPAGVGALLQGFLVDVYVIFNPTADSDLANGNMHIVGAVGELDGGDIVQDECNETLPFTAGEDGEVGTADDAPADWQNPDMELEADSLALSVQGVEAEIQDLLISAKFHPELTGFVGGTFAGKIDTRALVGLLDSEDPNAICDLVTETVGIECEDCGGGENFCLGVVAENVSGNYLDNIPGGLTLRSCVDIIDDATCGNGSYTLDGEDNGDIDPLLCPDWEAPVAD